jgi:predicted secreted Zn-dependent protease
MTPRSPLVPGLGPASRFTIPSLMSCALAVVLAACGPLTPSVSTPGATASPVAPSGSAVLSGIACVTAVAHLTAFSNQLGDELSSLRPKVTDPVFDSGGTSQIIARVSATMSGFEGLEERTAACAATASLVGPVASIRDRARSALDLSASASVNDRVSQREAGAALFGLLPDVLDVAAGTRSAASGEGLDAQIASLPEESTKPLESLPPLPTPRPDPTPEPPSGGQGTDDDGIPTYASAFFGPNASVTTYRVTGSTPEEIVRSINARGPSDRWLHGRAEALTLAIPHDRVAFQQDGASCDVVATASPAIYFSFKITIPRWTPSPAASRATITWWTGEIRHVATHENHHVELWRAAGVAMTKAVGTSSCTNLVSRLTKIAADTRRENCEFDMDEYGTALGLSLKDCLGS